MRTSRIYKQLLKHYKKKVSIIVKGRIEAYLERGKMLKSILAEVALPDVYRKVDHCYNYNSTMEALYVIAKEEKLPEDFRRKARSLLNWMMRRNLPLLKTWQLKKIYSILIEGKYDPGPSPFVTSLPSEPVKPLSWKPVRFEKFHRDLRLEPLKLTKKLVDGTSEKYRAIVFDRKSCMVVSEFLFKSIRFETKDMTSEVEHFLDDLRRARSPRVSEIWILSEPKEALVLLFKDSYACYNLELIKKVLGVLSTVVNVEDLRPAVCNYGNNRILVFETGRNPVGFVAPFKIGSLESVEGVSQGRY